HRGRHRSTLEGAGRLEIAGGSSRSFCLARALLSARRPGLEHANAGTAWMAPATASAHRRSRTGALFRDLSGERKNGGNAAPGRRNILVNTHAGLANLGARI